MDGIYYVYAYLRAVASVSSPAGTPYYIGKGKGHRAYDKNRLARLPKDRGRIVFIATGLSEADAHQIEILQIIKWGRIDLKTGCLRNKTNGGEGCSGRKMTPEQIEFLSSKRRGMVHSAETRLKISINRKGKVRSSESSDRARIKNTDKKRTGTALENLQRGRKSRNDAAVYRKIAATLKGHTVSIEVRERLRVASTGRKHSEETRQKMRESHARRLAVSA